MTIAILATFAAIATTPAARAAAGPVETDVANSQPGFASILLGLPKLPGLPATAAQPLPDDDSLPSGSETPVADASAAGSDPQLLATLGLPPPQYQQAVSPQAAASPTSEAVPPARPETAPTPTSATRAALMHALEIGDQRQQQPATLLAAEDKAAKFAVAAVAAPPSENAPTSTSEPATGSNNNLSTLGAPLPLVANGAAMIQDLPRQLQTPLRDPSWASEFGQKLLWFAGNEKQHAQLTLHPPQLGSIEITLNMDRDSAKAHFVSPNADVRGAIETAVPRLREMFASVGIELGQVSVGSESFRQQPDGQPESSRQPRPPADNAILGSDSASRLTSTTLVTHRGQGMIDTFA